MQTFVIFITNNSVDSEHDVRSIEYYRSLPGMVRNYFGNLDKVGPFTRSYGYIAISPDRLEETKIVDMIESIRKQLPQGHTSYTIPVVVDTSDTGFIMKSGLMESLRALEATLKGLDETFKFNILKNNVEHRLEPAV